MHAMISSLRFILIVIAVADWQHASRLFVVSNDDFNKIVGGQDAVPGEFPWQISLQIDGAHMCGSSIINARWILTAAHCVEKLGTKGMEVVAGKININVEESTEQRVPVEKIIMHPEYDPDQDYLNDIAILKLEYDLQFNLFVQPIPVPTQEKQEFTGFCTGTGWGLMIIEGSYVESEILQKVLVPPIRDEECQTRYSRFKRIIADSMLCAGYDEGGKDTCTGDSGGPLVCTGEDKVTYLAGVTSWGEGCAEPRVPGVYTQVSYYLRWIKATMLSDL